MYVCMRVSTQACIYPEAIPSVVPQDAKALLFELVSPTWPEIPWFSLADWPVNPRDLQIPRAGIISMHHYAGVLGIELRSSCLCSEHFTDWAISLAWWYCLHALFLSICIHPPPLSSLEPLAWLLQLPITTRQIFHSFTWSSNLYLGPTDTKKIFDAHSRAGSSCEVKTALPFPGGPTLRVTLISVTYLCPWAAD